MPFSDRRKRHRNVKAELPHQSSYGGSYGNEDKFRSERAAERYATPNRTVDRFGLAALDPSDNVLQLIKTSIERLDDLRDSDSAHQNEMAHLRAEHYRELRFLEAARIDSIRAVDVSAVAAAASQAEVRATALASQVTVSAETLRAQVATTAQAGQVALDAKIGPLDAKIAVLSQNMFEQQGQRTQQVDARDDHTMDPLLEAIARLERRAAMDEGGRNHVVEQRSKGISTTAWIGMGVAALGLVSAFMFSAVGIGLTIYLSTRT